MSFVPNNEKTKKLLLLYIAKEFSFPLTEDQFLRIIMDNEFMDYLDFKEYLNDLTDTGQIAKTDKAGLDVYEITEDGEFTLAEFQNLLPLSTKEAFQTYVEENVKEIKHETLLDSSYKYGQDGSIEVECHVRDKDSQLLTLTLYTDNEETAKQICSKWEKSSSTIYQTIYDSLLK